MGAMKTVTFDMVEDTYKLITDVREDLDEDEFFWFWNDAMMGNDLSEIRGWILSFKEYYRKRNKEAYQTFQAVYDWFFKPAEMTPAVRWYLTRHGHLKEEG